MHFANPKLLLLLLAIPPLVALYVRRMRRGQGSLQFASTLALEGIRPSWTIHARHFLFGMSMLALALSITALARPQKGTQAEEITSEGIDIVIALDASSSMAAEDFEPNNRFFVAKLVVGKFIEALHYDRTGLVVFAAKAVTRCPLTLDHGVLLDVLNHAEPVEPGSSADGTAIGNALATCLNRLRESKAKSRVIILVTDGVNNRGEIQPIDAAQMAKSFGVKIYAVGVGTTGIARVPMLDPVRGKIYADVEVKIDEASLKQIAETTQGLYYQATDRPSLENIFEAIGRLEKTKIKVKTYTHYNERFYDFLFPAMALLFIATVASYSRFGKIP
jgi:Ca-activated chloride channel homolog